MAREWADKWQQIWKEAVCANSRMIRNKEKGEESFNELIEKHPGDVMVLLEWAFAYETLGKKEEALEKFKEAKKHVKPELDDWKENCEYGIERIEKNLTKVYDIVKKSFFELHSYLYSPEEFTLKYSLLNAISRMYIENLSALSLFRSALEKFLVTIIKEKSLMDFDDFNKLNEMIDIVYSKLEMEDKLKESMDNIRCAGNAVLHHKYVRKRCKELAEDIDGRLKDFMNIGRFYKSELNVENLKFKS